MAWFTETVCPIICTPGHAHASGGFRVWRGDLSCLLRSVSCVDLRQICDKMRPMDFATRALNLQTMDYPPMSTRRTAGTASPSFPGSKRRACCSQNRSQRCRGPLRHLWRRPGHPILRPGNDGRSGRCRTMVRRLLRATNTARPSAGESCANRTARSSARVGLPFSGRRLQSGDRL